MLRDFFLIAAQCRVMLPCYELIPEEAHATPRITNIKQQPKLLEPSASTEGQGHLAFVRSALLAVRPRKHGAPSLILCDSLLKVAQTLAKNPRSSALFGRRLRGHAIPNVFGLLAATGRSGIGSSFLTGGIGSCGSVGGCCWACLLLGL